MTDAGQREFERAQKVLSQLADDGYPIPAETITDYAVVIATTGGTSLLFSGSDRRDAACLYAAAARLVLAERGTSGRDDGALPPMGSDN